MSGMALREMGERGRVWMSREFTWHQRAIEMLDYYRGLADARGNGRCKAV
jgi:hypothetical protein